MGLLFKRDPPSSGLFFIWPIHCWPLLHFKCFFNWLEWLPKNERLQEEKEGEEQSLVPWILIVCQEWLIFFFCHSLESWNLSLFSPSPSTATDGFSLPKDQTMWVCHSLTKIINTQWINNTLNKFSGLKRQANILPMHCIPIHIKRQCWLYGVVIYILILWKKLSHFVNSWNVFQELLFLSNSHSAIWAWK